MSKQIDALKLALEGAANYIDVLGGDSKKYRQLLAQQSNEPALDALKWIASHDLSGVDERALALMSYAFVHKARFAVLEATGKRA